MDATPATDTDTKAPPRLSNREKERLAEAAMEAKERVFHASREELELEDELRKERARFRVDLGELKESLRETVEAPHNGKAAQKVERYDAIIVAWQEVDEMEALRKATLHPILLSLEEARDRRVNAHGDAKQLLLPLDS